MLIWHVLLGPFVCLHNRMIPCRTDVFKECNMEHQGMIWDVHGGKKYMTDSQKSLIAIYKVGTVVAVLVIFIAYFGPGFKKLYKNLFVGHMHSTLPPSDTKFSDVDFIEGYIPGLVDPYFRKPLLACNLKDLDTNHIHWEGNWQAFNLNSAADFPSSITEEDRNTYFGAVVYYPPEGGGPKLNYHDYMKENHPDVFERLTIHKATEEEKEALKETHESSPATEEGGNDIEETYASPPVQEEGRANAPPLEEDEALEDGLLPEDS